MKKFLSSSAAVILSLMAAPNLEANAFCDDFGNSRIEQEYPDGITFVVDAERDPTLWCLSIWYDIPLDDIYSVNIGGYNHGMAYKLPIYVEKITIAEGMGIYGYAQRYSVSEESLRHLNDVGEDNHIVAGEYLYIPHKIDLEYLWELNTPVTPVPETTTAMPVTTPSTTTTTVASTEVTTTTTMPESTSTSTSTTTTTTTTTKTTIEVPVATTVESETTTIEGLPSYVVVKPGDFLSTLAENYGTTVSEIMSLTENQWIEDPNMIQVGWKIYLPTGGTVVEESASTDSTSTESSSQKIHVVKKDEYLSTIAEIYGVSVSEIMSLTENQWIEDPNMIQVGWEIVIPSSATTGGSQNTQQTQTPQTTPQTPQIPQNSSPYELPYELAYVVNDYKRRYPGMSCGVGLYDIHTGEMYEYNEYEYDENGNLVVKKINSCCTIKLSYVNYVLQYCKNNWIDIDTTYVTYKSHHYNFGSGVIKKAVDRGEIPTYTVEYLCNVCLTVSDNIAFNMLTEIVPLYKFYEYNRSIGGQNDGAQYGSATVRQRYNEWKAAIEFMNSGHPYGKKLYNWLDIAQYGYLEQGMWEYHAVLHKSGWCEGQSNWYNGADDVAYIDDRYMLIVMSQDDKTNIAHTDFVSAMGGAFSNWLN